MRRGQRGGTWTAGKRGGRSGGRRQGRWRAEGRGARGGGAGTRARWWHPQRGRHSPPRRRLGGRQRRRIPRTWRNPSPLAPHPEQRARRRGQTRQKRPRTPAVPMLHPAPAPNNGRWSTGGKTSRRRGAHGGGPSPETGGSKPKLFPTSYGGREGVKMKKQYSFKFLEALSRVHTVRPLPLTNAPPVRKSLYSLSPSATCESGTTTGVQAVSRNLPKISPPPTLALVRPLRRYRPPGR